jgi:hypothetical protein
MWKLPSCSPVVGSLIYLVVPDTITHHLYVGPKWFSMWDILQAQARTR